MNKKGWTLVEMMIAMGIIMIITSFLVANFKPKTQNTRIQAYAGIKNVIKGLIAVDDKYEKTPTANPSQGIFYQSEANTTSGINTFCMEMADAFSLKEAAKCNTADTTGNNRGVANMVLANGVEVYGLASDVKNVKIDGADSDIKFKNILIDVDGKKGSNKLGIDRFPLRIYLEDKLVLPVNCNEQTDGFFDWKKDQTVTTASNVPDHEYCKYGGKDFKTAINSKQNFLLDDEMITYDTYRASTQGEGSRKASEMIAFSQSFAATACGTFGGRRYLSIDQCKAMAPSGTKLRIYTKCVIDEMCDICTATDTCPLALDGKTPTTPGESGTCRGLYTSLHNDENTCLFLLHKPSAGMSAFVEGMIGDLDME